MQRWSNSIVDFGDERQRRYVKPHLIEDDAKDRITAPSAGIGGFPDLAAQLALPTLGASAPPSNRLDAPHRTAAASYYRPRQCPRGFAGNLDEGVFDLTDRGDIVLEPLVGSGLILTACELAGRVCRGVEIDPLYIDTIIRRFEAATGKLAILEATGEGFAALQAVRNAPD